MLIVFPCLQLITVEKFMVKHEIVVEILLFEIDTRIMDPCTSRVQNRTKSRPIKFFKGQNAITQKLLELGN